MSSEKGSPIPLQRYSFTLPPEIIEKVDQITKKLNMNRSMIVREALTQWLSNFEPHIQKEKQGLAVITYIYNHHDNRVISELLKIQHDQENIINFTTHIHLTHTTCFEIVVCRGKYKEIFKLANNIRKIKGLRSFSVNFAVEQ